MDSIKSEESQSKLGLEQLGKILNVYVDSEMVKNGFYYCNDVGSNSLETAYSKRSLPNEQWWELLREEERSGQTRNDEH